MAIIYSYPKKLSVTSEDLLLGVQVSDNTTKKITVGAITDYVVSTINTVPNYVNYGLASMTSSSTVANTATQLSIIGGNIVGSLIIPANSLTLGSSFKINLAGTYDSISDTADYLKIRIRTASGTTIALIGVNPAIMSNNQWSMNVDMTMRSIGGVGAASIMTIGSFVAKTSSVDDRLHCDDVYNLLTSGFDTTVDNTLEILASWTIADVGNSITAEVFTLIKTF